MCELNILGENGLDSDDWIMRTNSIFKIIVIVIAIKTYPSTIVMPVDSVMHELYHSSISYCIMKLLCRMGCRLQTLYYAMRGNTR